MINYNNELKTIIQPTNNCHKTILNFSFSMLFSKYSHKHHGTIYYTNCNISFYHSLVACKQNWCCKLFDNSSELFCSTMGRKFSKTFCFNTRKLLITKCMLYIFYVRWIFTITKWCLKSQCKETTIIIPTMLNLNSWKIYCYFLLRRKRMAAICFFMRLCIESLSKLSYTLTCSGWLPTLDIVIQWEPETFRIWMNSPLCISKANVL